MVDILEWRLQHQADRVAYEFVSGDELNGDTITYGRLAANARSISVGLEKHVPRGERVVIVMPPGLELISALLGVFYRGAVATMTAPPVSDRDRSYLRAVLQDLSASAIITSEHYKTNLTEFTSEHFFEDVPVLTVEELLQSNDTQWTSPGAIQNAPCLIQYTSGSSGDPKGVVLSHANLMHNSQIILQSFFNTSKSHGVIWLPPYHDMGLIGGILQPLYGGFITTLMSPRTFLQKPVRWLRLISAKKATSSGGPNFAYDLCTKVISDSELEGLDLSSWKVAFNGAEPIQASVLDAFSKAFKPYGFSKQSFMPCYGLAESTLYVTGNLKTDPPTILPAKRKALSKNRFELGASDSSDSVDLVSCGLPYYNETIKIVNPEDGTVVRTNSIGEIWVASPSRALGYWKRLEESQATFHAQLTPSDGKVYLRTGDLGFLHRSELFVTGRLKDLIIIRGANHIPQDIERTAQQASAVLAIGKGAALAIPTTGGEVLGVINEITKEAQGGFDEASTIELVRKALFEKHHISAAVIVLVKPGQIPRTKNGKLQRNQALQMFLDGEFREVSRWQENSDASFTSRNLSTENDSAPALEMTDAETQEAEPLNLDVSDPEVLRQNILSWMAAAIAKEVSLEPSEIDPDMHFGLYGLDSISAVQVLVKFEQVFPDVELDETLLWDYPNLNALTDYLLEVLEPEAQLR